MLGLRMPRAHLARYREIASVLAKERLFVPVAVAGVNAIAPAFHRRHEDTRPVGERLRCAAEQIGPSAIKLGQLLSSRPDLLPSDITASLRSLQDDVTPVTFDEVTQVVIEELGMEPDVAFAQFDPAPLAAASIGQVHAAVLPDGRPVAVKVQRPGIEAGVRTDLDIALRLVRWLDEHGQVPDGIEIVPIAEEFANALLGELDYEHEAHNMDRLREQFALDEGLVFPAVHWGFTTRRVLTMERIDGIPFNRLDLIDAAGLDRRALARRGVDAYMRMIYEHGFYHADPHPGNLFALPDGRIAFTDFGRVAALSSASRDAAVDLLLGFVDRDADLAAEALLEVARDPGTVRIGPLRSDLDRLFGHFHGTELARIDITRFTVEVMDIVRAHRLGMPSDLGLLMSTLAVLDGVGLQLDPEFDFVAQVRPFTEDVVREQYRPSTYGRQFARIGRRFMRLAGDLPLSVDRTLRRASEGEFRVAVRLSDYEGFVGRVEELVDRLAFAVLVAAFVVGFSRLLENDRLATWVHVMAAVGLIGATFVSGWMFVSIILSRRRDTD